MNWIKAAEEVNEEGLSKDIMALWNSKIKLDYGDLWNAGRAISGGFGFWGSSDLYRHDNPKQMVKAFVDALRSAGFTDVDIIFYGDWKDGRHMADQIKTDTSYDEFKKVVEDYGRKPEAVRKENISTYGDKIKVIKYTVME